MQEFQVALALALVLGAVLAAPGQPDQYGRLHPNNYNEKYRLQYHYSVPKGWLNDPSGLLYHNGVYHIYYQHNPADVLWGQMHWGHATSRDLIHWETHAPAMVPYDVIDKEDGLVRNFVFSGSVQVDLDNVTGLAPPKGERTRANPYEQQPDLVVAMYTVEYKHHQRQGLAYSWDGGMSFQQYAGNPVLDKVDNMDFRDPNVRPLSSYGDGFGIKDATGQKVKNETFIMTVSNGPRLSYYSSQNFKNWTFLSNFGENPDQGDKTSLWECPAMVTLRTTETQPDGSVVKVSREVITLSENTPTNGSAMQYFIGQFNGTHFINERPPAETNWLDWGADTYAGIPFWDDKLGRQLELAWMNNWVYSEGIPTTDGGGNWRGQINTIREMGIKRVGDRYHVTQDPIRELETLRKTNEAFRISNMGLYQPKIFNNTLAHQHYDFEFTMDLSGCSKTCGDRVIGLKFTNQLKEHMDVEFNLRDNAFYLDRRHSGQVDFKPEFRRRITAHRVTDQPDLVQMRVLLDRASVELFADHGLTVATVQVFPNEPYNHVTLYSTLREGDCKQDPKLVSFVSYPMKSMYD